MNTQNRTLVAIVNAVTTRTDSAGTWIQIAYEIIFITVASPSPIKMEIVISIVSIAHKRVSASTTATVILDGTVLIQVSFQHGNPIRIGIV